MKFFRNKKGDNTFSVDSKVSLLTKMIGNDENVLTFLHNTNTEETAVRILRKGFRFVSHLEYTTDMVSLRDPLTIEYFTMTRKMYGSYTIIIQISRDMAKKYTKLLEGVNHHFYEALTIKEPVKNSDGEFMYKLAPQFIKGYVNIEEDTFITNSIFDPYNDMKIFEQNTSKLLICKKEDDQF